MLFDDFKFSKVNIYAILLNLTVKKRIFRRTNSDVKVNGGHVMLKKARGTKSGC